MSLAQTAEPLQARKTANASGSASSLSHFSFLYILKRAKPKIVYRTLR